MPSRGKDVPCTDSEVKRFHLPIEHEPTGPFQGHQNKQKESSANNIMTYMKIISFLRFSTLDARPHHIADGFVNIAVFLALRKTRQNVSVTISIYLEPFSIGAQFDPLNEVEYFCLCFGAQNTTAIVWPTVKLILRMRT